MRITNIDTLSSFIDRLITENIKMFFFQKNGELDKVNHQQYLIETIKERISSLLEEVYSDGYEYTNEQRTFTRLFTDEVQELILNDIRIGEADRSRQESINGDDVDFYKLAFNEIRLRVANEGRAKNKNMIDNILDNITTKE